MGLVIADFVRPDVPPAPSTVDFLQTFPSQVAIFRNPLLLSLYASRGLPLNIVLVTCFASALSSMTNLFHPTCGVTAGVITASDVPLVFDATMLNE